MDVVGLLCLQWAWLSVVEALCGRDRRAGGRATKQIVSVPSRCHSLFDNRTLRGQLLSGKSLQGQLGSPSRLPGRKGNGWAGEPERHHCDLKGLLIAEAGAS